MTQKRKPRGSGDGGQFAARERNAPHETLQPNYRSADLRGAMVEKADLRDMMVERADWRSMTVEMADLRQTNEGLNA